MSYIQRNSLRSASRLVLAPLLSSLYINGAPAGPKTHLAVFADGTNIYATEKYERRGLCKLERSRNAVKSSERSNIKFNEVKIKSIYFCRRLRVSEDVHHLNGRSIHFVNNVKYLDQIFCIRQILEKKWEYNETVYQPFVAFN
jgi:hypothetical protein